MGKFAAHALTLALLGGPAWAGARATFLYPVADSVGKLSLGWAPLAWDAAASELLVVDSNNGVIDVFNDNGMVIYSFGDAGAFGTVAGVAVLPGGQPLVLGQGEAGWRITRCNFRGEAVETIAVRDVPKEFARNFNPSAIFVAQERIYVADKNAMKVLLTALDGAYLTSFELSPILGIPAAKATDDVMRGFSVDHDGNMLITVPTLFAAYIVAPDGPVRSFGEKGSLPGKFNVVGGIVADDDGHLFVADTLRCVVMVFDRETFRFLGEFGNRGRSPGSLINPLEIAVGNGRVYVTQSVGTVKAFGVQFE